MTTAVMSTRGCGSVSPQSLASSPVWDLASVIENPVWAEVYAACCCDTGESLSIEAARSFRDAIAAQNPASNPDRLVLRCLRIGATAVSCLALQMKDRTITHADLSDNQLGDHSVLSVRSLIRSLPHLQWLGLSGNLIGPEGARELAEELEANKSLESLVLGVSELGPQGRGFRPNSIGAEGLRAMLEALQRNTSPTLTSLSLCNTSLGPEAGAHFAAFLERENTLLHLDISSNPLSSEGVCSLLPQCVQLRVLDIADTGCRGELIHSQLCAMLQRSTSLTHLSLAQNPLEARPLRRIARAVANCESLVSLSLERTSMDTEAVTVLADALLAAPVQSLTELDLSDNQLCQVEAATALAHAMAKSVLQVLRLNRNSLGDVGVRELADALDPQVCSGCSLQHLELNTCRIGSTGASHLFLCLARNEHLRVLRLGDNFLDGSLDISLVEQLTHVLELQLTGNRLSHSAMQRAAQACARNRRTARDEGPLKLRAEMHRLLFQETKRGHARQQMSEDEAELNMRKEAAAKARQELNELKVHEADQQRKLKQLITAEKNALDLRWQLLADTKTDLEDTATRFAEMHANLRDKLREREHQLCDLQVQAEQIDSEFERQKVEHPQTVHRVKEGIKSAIAERKRCQETAAEMRERLRQLQERSLIDFRP
eukprot:TRINITY_DN36226_c0_g1_i1.p1 TRINITY_DN36226_c0_g1~~TRINITY_DN36226_c0_g1_i1.p1  ORF type:complete len:660 (+),score=112.73 TRINITY_DN36226_c0_g1_i1:267-2246(+)